jgi:hypothetical protein
LIHVACSHAFGGRQSISSVIRSASPVTGSAFLDKGSHGFGVLRRTRRNDHLLGLVIQLPAPVISSAPTSGSSPLCLIIRRNAGVRWSDSEFRASGRFKVITATRSRIAHSSSSVPVSIEIDSSVMVLTFQVQRLRLS